MQGASRSALCIILSRLSYKRNGNKIVMISFDWNDLFGSFLSASPGPGATLQTNLGQGNRSVSVRINSLPLLQGRLFRIFHFQFSPSKSECSKGFAPI